MPRHDYKCDCGYEFEAIVGVRDSSPKCPKCDETTKLIFKQAPVIHFNPTTDNYLREEGII